MSKELLENLLIEFDEMGFEPTTLCDNQREVDSFRNRLKQVLDCLKTSKELELIKLLCKHYYIDSLTGELKEIRIKRCGNEDEIDKLINLFNEFKEMLE